MTRKYYEDDYCRPPLQIFLQIYTIYVNYLLQGENGEFRRKVTNLHPWFKDKYSTVLMDYQNNLVIARLEWPEMTITN